MDFSYDSYFALLGALKGKTAPLRDFGKPQIYLRHDIDLCLSSALRMASTEADHGYSATYMFIPTSPLYELSPDLLRPFIRLGHEVALHFDYLTSGISDPEDFDALQHEVKIQCDLLANLTGEPVRSVSFHRPIKAFLGGPDYLFGLVNAYSSTLMAHYRSDSAGRWRSNPMDLAACEMGQLLTHPIWWNDMHRDSSQTLDRFREGRDARLISETVPGVQ